jgi:hypothetical protein
MMTNLQRLLLAFALAIFATVLPLKAQEITPEALAQQQLEAVQRGDWEAYAAQMHPKALQRFKEMMSPLFRIEDRNVAREMQKTLFGGRNSEELQRMTPDQFFTLFMSSMARLPGMGEALKNAKGEVIGRVNEGDSRAHVVVRASTSIPGMVENYTRMDVVSFERDGGTWKGLLAGDMELKISQMLQQLSGAGARPAASAPPKKDSKKSKGDSR